MKEVTKTLNGRTISAGFGEGPVFVYHDVLNCVDACYHIDELEVHDELHRFDYIFNQISEDLAELVESVKREISRELSAVFKAHIAFLHDPSLKTEVQREIKKELVSAEGAVKKVFLWWEQRFRLSESEIANQKADDIRDLARRLLLGLAGIKNSALEDLPEDSVLLAPHLLPSDMIYLANRNVAGILIESGTPASHAALFARELGIPCVGGIRNLVTSVPDGSYALIDADEGKVVINPGLEDHATFQALRALRSQAVMRAKSHAQEPAITPDDVRIPVLANVGCEKDTKTALTNGADGIGLYRVENLYLSLSEPPNVNTLLTEMEAVLSPMQHLPICIRLLDVGGDKPLPYVASLSERNPSLGCRGIRFLFEYPHLLHTQIKALLLLSQKYQLSVLTPMVNLPEELIKLREVFDQIAAELKISQTPPIGAMIETPAAAMNTHALSQYADFLSFGTNDLTQYAFAADRENTYVADYFNDTHEAIFKLMKIAQQEAPGMSFSVCGELAGYPDFTTRLLNEVKVDSLSVVPPLIPLIKESVRSNSRSMSVEPNITQGEKKL